MNIFVLHDDPVIAAQMQCDAHVVKMTLESMQMLSTCHRMLDGKLTTRPSVSGKRMVKYYDLYEGSDDLEAELLYMRAVHFEHPCNQWLRRSEGNYRWMWEHTKALCNEYTYRYGKTHKNEMPLLWGLQSTPRNIPKGGMTPFELAFRDYPECLALKDPVKAYRAFYETKQHRFKMVWTKRKKPRWFKNAKLHTA